MASYVFRQQAVDAARKLGIIGFRTVLDPETEMWKVEDQARVLPAEKWAEGREFVHHTEAVYIDGILYGVLVVNVTIDELKEEPLAKNEILAAEKQTARLWMAGFIVEPLTPSLWFADPSTRQATGEPKPIILHAQTREHSAIISPVKECWRIFEKMASASRKEIIAACLDAGIHKSTANTQYYHWNKKQNG